MKIKISRKHRFKSIKSSLDIFTILIEYYRSLDKYERFKEHFLVVALKVDLTINFIDVISIGNLKGSVMPNSNNLNASSHQYGFNGQMNDNEVHGSGNSLDFGARMYNPRLGRWFAVDKEYRVAPAWSPYRFGFDNPNFFRDGDGNFEIPIHALITTATIKALKLPMEKYSGLVKGVKDADYKGFHKDLHFDGRKNFTEVNNTFKSLVKKLNSLDIQKQAYEVGYALHTLQDFYAHSNYVELYIEYYSKKGGDISKLQAKDIPLYQVGVADEMFRKEYLEKRLRTGDFHLIFNEKNPKYPKEALGEDTHYRMNKDSNKSLHGKELIGKGSNLSYHDVARQVSFIATYRVVKALVGGKKVSTPRFP